ncbi:MAG: hypothetical protein ACR2OC_01650 [Solirubrobacterales bacterium]
MEDLVEGFVDVGFVAAEVGEVAGSSAELFDAGGDLGWGGA